MFAEYVRMSQDAVVLAKPTNLTYEQAAAVPVAGFTALQALRDKAKLQPGQKVLVNGASGGVGTFAVQLAKAFGADVTGVCSTRNVELVKSIGADRVVDYTSEDFTTTGERYDIIVDTAGNRSIGERRRVLTPKGVLVVVGGPNKGNWIGPLGGLVKMAVVAPFVSQRMVFMLANPSRDDLVALSELIEAGKITPVIDRTYRFEEVPEAIRYVEEGHARAKVVVTV
jgi:NADPH:quinone reductase-like Zn-dependent oxidoreductase